MKLKLDENGNVVLQDGMPVYIHDDGTELPFDASQAVQKITSLNAEAKGHREAKEKAESELKKFAGISDPKVALDAIETLKKIDQKQLIDNGQVEQVKAEMAKNFQEQLDEANKKYQAIESQFYEEKIGGSFANSQFIKDKVVIPPHLLRGAYGKHFKVEDGKIVARYESGEIIQSKTRFGEPADFDEAMDLLISRDPYKDHILKASDKSGSGTPSNSRTNPNAKTISRGEFEKLDPTSQSKALGDGVSIVD